MLLHPQSGACIHDGGGVDVFALRDRLVSDYEEFTRSFINVRDPRIDDVVDRELSEGLLWPESLIQLNPSFAPGASIDELAAEGILHDANRAIFRRNKTEGAAGAVDGSTLRLHRHQEDAIRVAATGANYVLTTGTGSGKSLTYIVPIVDRILREGPGKGIRAIVIYPMNALANSQAGELEKFLKFGFPNNAGPVTYRSSSTRAIRGEPSSSSRARSRDWTARPPRLSSPGHEASSRKASSPQAGPPRPCRCSVPWAQPRSHPR